MLLTNLMKARSVGGIDFMVTVIRKILDLLSSQEKFFLSLQFVLLIGMACIEMAGIASILPFMAVVSHPDLIRTNRWLVDGYNFLGFSSTPSFLLFFGLMVLGIMICSNLFKTLYTWVSLKYDNKLYYNLARRLLASYMARPYEFFLKTNTAEMGKNVL